jgi:hypothetical protein
MRKITYRAVYNRKKHLNAFNKALLQVEAYLKSEKFIFLPIFTFHPNSGIKENN